jgi:hypothetical protein
VSIFQILYKSEYPSLTICESQIDEFLGICNSELDYQTGKVFNLENLGKFPIDHTIDIIPYFYSDGILVSESLFIKLKDVFGDSGQWIACKYKDLRYFYFLTSIVLDAIDYEVSGCKYIDGYMVSIDPIIFKSMDYSSIYLFRIPRRDDDKPIWLFATEQFKNTMKELGVSNLRFVVSKI